MFPAINISIHAPFYRTLMLNATEHAIHPHIMTLPVVTNMLVAMITRIHASFDWTYMLTAKVFITG
jgi:hypothetical protein